MELSAPPAAPRGPFVSLIGAGPGDVGLLTLRGREALARADVVLFDALAHPGLLEFCPQAQTIYVGKHGHGAQTRQEDIHALLLLHARAGGGQRVARLKGGDAFVFGRGGEEALACAAAGIPFEVIPGVTSAVAAPAYAGIPVTHRAVARSFTVVTGHDLSGPHLPAACTQADTLVVLMGVQALPDICAALLAAGRSPQTPTAAIERASYPDQRVIRATLETLDTAAAAARLVSPSVLVIGEVAALHDQLAWFQPTAQALSGQRIVVTRTRPGASPLAGMLRERGATVTELPLLAFEPAGHPGEVLAGVREHRGWAIFSSEYAVSAFFTLLEQAGLDARALAGLKVAAVGSGTRGALLEHHIHADYCPPRSGARHLGEGLPASPGELAIHFGSQQPDRALQAALAARELDYLLLETYRVRPQPLHPASAEALAQADIVTLSSSVAAPALADVAGTDWPVLSIGPQTTQAAREAGFTRIVQSARADLSGLVEACGELRPG